MTPTKRPIPCLILILAALLTILPCAAAPAHAWTVVGASALPDGTTASTQAITDASQAVANSAFVQNVVAAANLVPIINASADITLTAAQCAGGHVIMTTNSKLYLTNCTTVGHGIKLSAQGALHPR